MPLPEPRATEDRADFMTRCMSDDVARREFPDAIQRMAVCVTQWEERE